MEDLTHNIEAAQQNWMVGTYCGMVPCRLFQNQTVQGQRL